MGEVALYRKYRSNDFSEVVGQAHVVDTLTQALSADRISHAYLFTGPRGTGKTTLARILAKAVNCTGDKKPCLKCDFCQIETASNLDLIEIDAASNRRIDEIRDLREKINLAPSLGKYKVYIIDEVHMLTNEAFNALLKTLEEPPAHAIFILATTEAHKLPATIISRTQRFNFKPISLDETAAQLGKIAKLEGFTVDAEGIALLAEAAEGSLRDAISLLDQVGTNSSKLDAAQVRSLLGWSEQESIAELSTAMSGGDVGQSLAIIDRLSAQGIQSAQIINQLSAHWRHIMRQAAKDDGDNLATIASILEQLIKIRKSPLPGLALEAAVVQISAAMRQKSHPSQQQQPKDDVASPAPAPQPKNKSSQPAKAAKAATTTISSEAAWSKALFLIKEANNSLYALIRSCQNELKDNELIITCRFTFHRQRLEESKNRSIIEKALKQAYGSQIKLIIVQGNSTISDTPQDDSKELVTAAMEILGGELVND